VITYEPDKNRFIVPGGGQSMAPVMKLPMRRWMQKMGIWIVPATKSNCLDMAQTMPKWPMTRS
jgi:hypothetical protein